VACIPAVSARSIALLLSHCSSSNKITRHRMCQSAQNAEA